MDSLVHKKTLVISFPCINVCWPLRNSLSQGKKKAEKEHEEKLSAVEDTRLALKNASAMKSCKGQPKTMIPA